MRKNTLMIAAAVAALSTSMAFAQSPTTPSTQGSPSAGQSAPVGGSGSMKSDGSVDAGKKGLGAAGGASGTMSGATTGAGATTETNKAGDFKSNQRQKGAQQDKAGSPNNRMGQSDKPAAKSETTGQAPSERSGASAPKSNDQMRSGSDRDQPQTGQSREMKQQNSKDGDRSGAPGARSSEGRSSTTNVNVNLSTEQRTRIKEVIVRDKSAPRVANVNFSLNVGTPVPRTVRHVVVPTTIVEIYPAWRGFHYFMAGDQIVIIDPNTLEIVAILDA